MREKKAVDQRWFQQFSSAQKNNKARKDFCAFIHTQDLCQSNRACDLHPASFAVICRQHCLGYHTDQLPDGHRVLSSLRWFLGRTRHHPDDSAPPCHIRNAHRWDLAWQGTDAALTRIRSRHPVSLESFRGGVFVFWLAILPVSSMDQLIWIAFFGAGVVPYPSIFLRR